MSDVGELDDFVDGEVRRVDVEVATTDGTEETVAVAVVRVGEDLYALDDVCSHANVSLSDGEVWCDELELECPKHGSAFSLVTGEPSTLPATAPVEVFEIGVIDGRVVVGRADSGGDE